MEDRDAKISLLNTLIKILLILTVIFISVLITYFILEDQLINEFESLNCNEKEQFIREHFDINGKTSSVEFMIENFNIDCKNYGKFFLNNVEDIATGLVFIPSSEMQEGIEYEIEIKTNQTESSTNDQLEETNNNFNIEIKK